MLSKETKRDLYEGLGVFGRTVLEWIINKYMSIRRIALIVLQKKFNRFESQSFTLLGLGLDFNGVLIAELYTFRFRFRF